MLRQFAEYQPFSPTTETLRGLLTGTPIGSNAIIAVAWSLGIAAALGLSPRAPENDERPWLQGLASSGGRI